MKTTNIIQRLGLFLLVLVLAVPALAQKERGGGSTFSIGSAADWKTFCDRVNGGETTLNAKLTANIELNADIDFGQEIVMVGNQNHLYSGTFDGQGHTLTINWNTGTSVRVSPFQNVKNTTIKNLHVKGEIKSKADGLTGLINDVYGTTTISGCIIEVNLKAKTILAGMVRLAIGNAKLTITDCIVKGDFTVTKKGGKISGFVCRQYGNCTLTNCLYLGTNNANNNENYTFAGDNTEVNNCYYLNPCGNAQGTPITKEQLRSGEVAHLLQNGRGKTVWGQVLGTDTIPQLTAEAAKHVYEVKFTLNNEVKATRYANKDGKVILPTTKDIVGESYNPHHYYALTFGGGFSASTTITEDRQVAVTLDHKEYYEIKNKDDWKAFCDIVESGQTSVDAKLTQDVDLGEEIVMAGTADPSYYNFFYYTGTFDGQGHTLKFNWNAGKDDRIAPFKYVKDATIKNLRTQGKITKKGYGLSGMVYIALGTTTITGCISDVDITGGDGGWNDSQAAGMVQDVADGASVTITDCLVKGSITDNADEDYRAMAGFVFSNSGTYTLTRCLYVGKNNAPNDSYTFGTEHGISATFTDCYYLNPCGKAQGDKITEAQLKNGYVAHKLQGDRTDNVWGQTLGTDLEPLPTTDATKRVYEVKFTYNGEVKATRYATNGQSIHGGLPTAQDLLGTGYNPHHYYAIAFADGFNASTTVNADRKVDITLAEKDCYEIASKADWKTFCDLVNSGQNAIDAKMTADVDLGEDIMMLGYDKSYSGTFDGNGHTLKINWNSGDRTWIAPFQTVYGATIKNLRTEGEINSSTHFLSGLVHEVYGTTNISGCISNVNITSSYTGQGCDAAGLIECVRKDANVTITDCVVKGKFYATTESGKKCMSGFVYNQYGKCTITNCLYAGTNNTTTGSNTFAEKATVTNCYYLNPCGKAQGEPVTKEQLKNGYVAHKLQGMREETVWGQVLGTDTIPQPTADAAKRVRKVDFTYKNDVKATRYANDGKSIHGGMPTFTAKDLLGTGYNPHHYYAIAFEGGFNASTPVNADRKVDITLAEKDCYEIASKENWKEFCVLVNGGQTKLNAKMTANVDLGSDITMVGTNSHNYSGTFDGQNHTLKLNWDSGSNGYIAPFSVVEGATIRNLRTEGNIKSSYSHLSGLILTVFGKTTITNCVSDVNITSSKKSGSCAIAGMALSIKYGAVVTFTDCIVKGKYNTTLKEGSIFVSGFVTDHSGTSTFNNCIYLGDNVPGGGYTFAAYTYLGPTLNNCYYLNACGKAQGDKITEAQLKNGEATKLLQGDRTDACHWAQTLGDEPSPYFDIDKSKTNYVYYDAAKKGWVCDDFRLTDGQPLPIGLDFTAATVTYERNFNGAQKATLCLPYDLYAQGFKAYTLSGGNKNEVHFKETKDKLTAYTPYYITADGTPLLGGTNIEVKAYTGANLTTSANGYSIKGTVVSMDNATAAAANAYILQDDGMFHKVTTEYPEATVPAYRAYITCPKTLGAKQFSVILDGETTGIGDVTNEANDGKNGPVYDLQGRRVADRLDDARHRLPAGVYIVGGRKVIVK